MLCDGFVEPPRRKQAQLPRPAWGWGEWIEYDGAAYLGQAFLPAFRRTETLPIKLMRLHRIWIQFHRASKLRIGRLKLQVIVKPDQSKVGVSLGIRAIELQCFQGGASCLRVRFSGRNKGVSQRSMGQRRRCVCRRV